MKLLLVDDHPLFAEGLQYLLETYGISVTGVAYSGEEAVKQARLIKPDMILMDIKMPGISGIDTLKLIKSEMPETKVVMLTSSVEEQDLFEAVKYGASGYLLKSTGAEELIGMLQGLQQGEANLSPGLAIRMLGEFKNGGVKKQENTTSENEQLTPRQLEILEMVAEGDTYKEVGERLGLTERTVKYHMGNIIQILHAVNRAQVIAYAAKEGLVGNTNETQQKSKS